MAEERCIFCNIYNEKAPADILYKDEDVAIFPDIRPASKHHYLVIPKDHLPNAKQLSKGHIPVVENLIRHGKRVLEEKSADLEDAKYGFHWPPFNSISHLHLHVISPASQMSFLNKLIFQDGSMWFVKVCFPVRYEVVNVTDVKLKISALKELLGKGLKNYLPHKYLQSFQKAGDRQYILGNAPENLEKLLNYKLKRSLNMSCKDWQNCNFQTL